MLSPDSSIAGIVIAIHFIRPWLGHVNRAQHLAHDFSMRCLKFGVAFQIRVETIARPLAIR